MIDELEFQDEPIVKETVLEKPVIAKQKSKGLYGDFSFILDIYINDGNDSDIEGDYYGNQKNPYMSYGSVAEEDFL